MKPQVTLIDYGVGNLFSVSRALERCGAEVVVSGDPSAIDRAERLVLPGVGAFAGGMQGLRERGLIEPIRRYAASDRPLLGICLGMQMFATAGEEFGEHAGLGLVKGRVVAIPNRSSAGTKLKVPHIGWVPLQRAAADSWRSSPLRDTDFDSTVYLVHSYHLIPTHNEALLAYCDYGGNRITAAVARGRIWGFQFHPEKSGPVGLGILRTFLSL